MQESSHRKKYFLEVSYYLFVVQMYTNPYFGVSASVLMSEFKYRDRASIVVDILDTIRSEPKGETKTGIMRGANLNFEQANRYLELLVLRGFIKEVDPLGSQELGRYKTTKEGLELVSILERKLVSLR